MAVPSATCMSLHNSSTDLLMMLPCCSVTEAEACSTAYMVVSFANYFSISDNHSSEAFACLFNKACLRAQLNGTLHEGLVSVRSHLVRCAVQHSLRWYPGRRLSCLCQVTIQRT